MSGRVPSPALTSHRRAPDQASAPDVSFGRREAELTWYGRVGLGGVEHGGPQVGRRRVVHLTEQEQR